MRSESIERPSRGAAIVCGFFLIAGMAVVVLPHVANGALPGGIHDSRLNRFILEHFFQVVTGRAEHFTELPMLYPWINTIALSDTHWGTAPVYALLRLMGADPEQAFAGWFAIGFILNYLSTYAVLRLFGLQALGAAAGAFLFSFGLPVVAQVGHVQLLYRFCVPWAVWVLYRYLDTRDARLLALLMLLVAVQLIISFYTGVFLALLLGAYLIVLTLQKRPFASREALVATLRSLVPTLPTSLGSISAVAVLLSATIAILLAVAIPYLRAIHLYHLTRPWWEIKSMLPRPVSYIWTSRSELWNWIRESLGPMPMENEHAMFFGLVPVACVALVLVSRRLRNSDILIRQNLYALAVLVLLTLCVGGFSFYALLVQLPGLSAIRAVARIILVMLFPVAVIMGGVLDLWWSQRSSRPWLGAVALSASLFLIFEAAFTNTHSTTIEEWRGRLQALGANISVPVGADSIIVVANQKKDTKWERDVDAMILAQSLHAKTMNGYSGHWPPNWRPMETCEDILDVIRAGEEFRQKHSNRDFKVDVTKIVPIGFGDCSVAFAKATKQRSP